ncbi:MAG: hypothetical protein PWP65_915 [Clostridia bacterium]|nr:hypothetical protein [Clostridia bacterium]
MDIGIILLGHGSRIPAANEGLRQLAAQVQQRLGGLQVEACYMMRSRPTLAEGIDSLAIKGAKEVVVVPLFLFNGLHVQRDIPEELERLRFNYPDLKIIYAANLGADSRIADIIIERIREVKGGVLPA